MKIPLLALFLVPSVLFAQVSQQPIPGLPRRVLAAPTAVETLADNYQVALTITDKDAAPVEVSVVVASSQFSASLGEQGLTFAGTLTVEESGGVVVAYSLGWESPITVGTGVQYKTSSTQGSVRLKLGEEVNIIRAGGRTARLSVKKLETTPVK